MRNMICTSSHNCIQTTVIFSITIIFCSKWNKIWH